MSENKFSERVKSFEEALLPRRSPRRYIAYLALTALMAIPVGEHIGDHVAGTAGHQVTNDLQPAIEKQGKDVSDKASDIQKKVQEIADTANAVNGEIDVLKKALRGIGIVIPEKVDAHQPSQNIAAEHKNP